ncbi:MAG: anti-sigma-K factor RskA [Alphaproteobacteria bacterium]
MAAKLVPLNADTAELAPLPETWQKIKASLNTGQPAKHIKVAAETFSWLALFKKQWPSAIAVSFCLMIALFVVNQPVKVDALSYVAVLTNSEQTPQVVASTYGNSKKLVLDIVDLPSIDEEHSYELWIRSKTDNQTRSLGEIPKGLLSFQRQLSQAEWRLIVDSSYLIISVEEEGGLAIGEPSDMILSKGLCIRLSGWEEQI